MTDHIINSIFAVAHDDGNPDTVKSAFPEYPGENPTKSTLVSWVKHWEYDLDANGYSAPRRGEVPFELKKLEAREPIPVPRTADDARKAAIELKNAEIEHANKVNKAEFDARILEMKTRVAVKIKKALHINAPILLKSLLTKHQCKEGDTWVPDAHDGFAMFKELASKIDVRVSDTDAKKYEKMYEKIRDNPLPDNCPPQMFSQRINAFNVHVNPYLEASLDGERLGAFVLGQLPASLAGEGRTLKRELKAADKLKDADHVIAKVFELIEQAHDLAEQSDRGG